MRQLTESQLKLIEARVKRKGASSRRVMAEIVDHVSCAVEEKLVEITDFSQALDDVITGFGDDGISVIQRESSILLRNKRKRQLGLSVPVAAILMFTAIVVNASGRPDSRPYRESLVPVNESFSENINGFLYDVTGKLDIYATANGEVEKIIPVYRRNKKKYSIILKHKNGYKTIYANLQAVYTRKGAYVEKGALLGEICSSQKGEKAFFAYKILNSGKAVDVGSYY